MNKVKDLNMEYNTVRAPMRISEYGRNVQRMAAHIKTLATKAERTTAANTLINVMGQLNPTVKEQSDYKQKLWDHLFMIAGYELDVDAPFPKPEPPLPNVRPNKPSYNNNRIRYRYYGRNVELMLKKAAAMDPSPSKEAFLNVIASFMKMAYRVWNDDKVPDNIIIEHIRELTGGKAELKEINEMAAHNENFTSPKVRRDGMNQGNYNNKNNFNKNKNNQNNYPKKNNNNNNFRKY